MSFRLLLLALFVLAVPSAQAQQPPTRLVVGFAPGGPVDTVARILGESLGKELESPVIVENKPGANAGLAALEVKKAPADGRTLWITSVGAAVINRALNPNLNYDVAKDLQPISLVANNVELMVVNKNHRAKSAAEFIAIARAAKDPLPFASTGFGSIPHLALEQLSDVTGVKFTHVPYRGAAPAINDLAGGSIEAFFGDVAALIGNIGSEGLLRPIGIAAHKRHPLLPDVPTMEEQGLKGIDTNNWYAIYGPKSLGPDAVQKLNRAVRQALQNRETAEKLLNLGAEPAPSSPEALAELQARDARKWGDLITARNIKAP